jgi:hypothetical protein
MSELLCAQVLAAFQRCQRDGASAPAVDSTVGPWDELAVSPYQNPDGNLQCGQEGDSGGPILLHPSAGIWLQLATVSASFSELKAIIDIDRVMAVFRTRGGRL